MCEHEGLSICQNNQIQIQAYTNKWHELQVMNNEVKIIKIEGEGHSFGYGESRVEQQLK